MLGRAKKKKQNDLPAGGQGEKFKDAVDEEPADERFANEQPAGEAITDKQQADEHFANDEKTDEHLADEHFANEEKTDEQKADDSHAQGQQDNEENTNKENNDTGSRLISPDYPKNTGFSKNREMIKLESIVKQFTLGDETVTAVNHATLTVYKGDFVSIIGPSGSGKSTLMNIIGMLDRADEGTYLFDNMDVTQLSDDEQAEIRNKKIGFVFQSFHLLQKLTAVENVMTPLLYRGMSEKDARARAEEMLDKLKLKDRKKHLPQQLSGGQQQRVAIARALAGDPELILADEPTGALDQTTGHEILRLLQKLNDDGQTIILITHDINIAAQTKRIVHIEDGRLTEREGQN